MRLQCAVVTFILCSCSSLERKPPYTLTLPEDRHVNFSGRGSASGPMLMSAMGPAGIAVGLAIDVGIGKDIEKFGFTDGLKLDELFAYSATETIKTSIVGREYFSKQPAPNFQVSKIGFVELSGQNNLIQPAIELSVQKGTWQKTYRYPEDFQAGKDTPLPGATLEQLKSIQSPARQLLQQAVTQVIKKSINDWQADSVKK